MNGVSVSIKNGEISIGGSVTEKTVRTLKGLSLLECAENYVVIDLETTGLDARFDCIIEFAAVRIENGVATGKFQSLVNPQFEIDGFVSDLTGITNEMLSVAPVLNDVLPLFVDFVGNSVIVGHNVNFDVNFIYDACMKMNLSAFSNNFIDTMRLSRRLFKEERHHRLCDLVKRFSISKTVEHRALSDALQTLSCYEYMKRHASENGISFVSLAPNKKGVSANDIASTVSEYDETTPIFGKVFVFTGTLEKMLRKDAMQIVADFGGVNGDNVTKKTNFLVMGDSDYCTQIKDGKSNKQKKAEQLKLSGLDIEIISEDVFYDMISQ